MKIQPKNPSEIKAMRSGGKILHEVLKATHTAVKPGQTLREIDKLISQLIYKHGGTPAFLGYQGFPASSCLSVNSAIVHQIPDDYTLREGDILGIDVGVKFQGYYTDAAFTMPIGQVTPSVRNLLLVTQAALRIGVESALAGNQVKDIGTSIERFVKSQGQYGVVRDLAGHGVGRNLQELPEVLNYTNNNKTDLVNGMTIAIEPMICLGDAKVELGEDNWTVRSKSGSLGAQFETTIVINDTNPEILVPFPFELALQP